MRLITLEKDGPAMMRLADMLEGIEHAAGRRTRIKRVGTLFAVAYEHTTRHPPTKDEELRQILADVTAYERTGTDPPYVEIARRALCG